MRGATARSPSSGLSQPPWVPGGRGDSGLGPERPGDAGAAELADLGNKVGGLQVSSAGEKPPWLPAAGHPDPGGGRFGDGSVPVRGVSHA